MYAEKYILSSLCFASNNNLAYEISHPANINSHLFSIQALPPSLQKEFLPYFHHTSLLSSKCGELTYGVETTFTKCDTALKHTDNHFTEYGMWLLNTKDACISCGLPYNNMGTLFTK